MNVSERWAALRARLADAARERRADPGRWPATALTVFCVTVGFWLRARGFLYDVPTFWLDECAWAILIQEQSISELLIRPPGFIVVSRAMAALFGPTETPLRTMPWVASAAALAMAPFLARRLFRADAARLLFLAVIAFHPTATDLAKEFKPYSTSLALHMGLMLLTLRYLASKKKSHLLWLLGVAVAGTLFAQDLVFSFPGVFALVGYDALRHDRTKLTPIVVAAGMVVVLLLAQYFLIWSGMPRGESEYWAQKYRVFHSEESGVSFAEWFRDRYERLAGFPGYQRSFWKPWWLAGDERKDLRKIGHLLWVVLHVIGIAAMVWRRAYREAALLCLPLAVLVAFNLAGLWPFGAFRTNAFLLVNVAGIAAMAFDESTSRRRPFGAIVPAALLIVIPFFFFESGWPPKTKRAFTRTSDYPEVLELLANRAPAPPAPRRPLIIARECEQWRYFLTYHPRTKPMRAGLEAGFDVHCIENIDDVGPAINRLTTSATPTWLVSWHQDPSGLAPDIERIENRIFQANAVSAYVHNPKLLEKPLPKKSKKKRRRSSDADD